MKGGSPANEQGGTQTCRPQYSVHALYLQVVPPQRAVGSAGRRSGSARGLLCVRGVLRGSVQPTHRSTFPV